MTAVTIRAVLFDLGDTLWHFPKMPPFEHIRGETVRRVSNLLRWWGVEPAGELFFLGRDIRIAVEQAERDAYADHCLSPDYAGIAQQVAAAKGLHISRRQAEHLWEVWNLGGSFFDRTLHDDVLPTLTWLRDRGYRLGAVSNRMYGGPRFHAELRDMGLDSLFEALAISCEVGHMKPHPAIFLRAVEDLGVRPEECAMVGDSLRADVGGAGALGMTTIWRRSRVREGEDRFRPDHIIDTIADIRELPPFRG